MAKDKKYMKRYMLERYHKRRNEIIIKLGSVCKNCGTKESLEIDHIDAKQKTYDIAKLLAGGSKEKVDDEIKKCQLLCRSCHNLKTLNDMENIKQFNLIDLTWVLENYKKFIKAGYSFDKEEKDAKLDEWLKAHFNKLKEMGCIKTD